MTLGPMTRAWAATAIEAGRRLLALTIVLAAVACTGPEVADPPVLRVSAIPDQSAEKVRWQHAPLIERVCERARVQCRWVDASSYESLVDAVGAGDVDLAYFGGVTFAQARERHGAVPVAMRDVDLRFTSVVLVRKDSPARTLADIRGRAFSFANRSSTSGHHMLRHRLAHEGVLPERYFSSVSYAPTHDAAMDLLHSGEVDAVGVNASIYYDRLIGGEPRATALRVVWQSAPYVDYVWATRRGLSTDLRARLLDAFLDLDRGVAPDRIALQRESAGGFVPAFPSDFDEMRAVLAASARASRDAP